MVEKDEGRWGRQRTVDGDPPRSRARSRRLGTRKSARRRSAEHAPRKRYLYTSLRFFLGISMMTECCLSTTSARLEGWLSTLEGRADGTETREEMCWVSRRSSHHRACDSRTRGPRGARPGRDRRRVRSRRGRDARRAGRVAGAYLGDVRVEKGDEAARSGVHASRRPARGAPLRLRPARVARGAPQFLFVFDAAISSASASRPSRPNRERGLGVRFEIKRSFPESTLVIRRKRIRRRCGRLSDAASGAFADARGFR